MQSYEVFPARKLERSGRVSEILIDMGTGDFQEVAAYLYNMEYGYNSGDEGETILFSEGRGTCGIKQASLAVLGRDQRISVEKVVDYSWS